MCCAIQAAARLHASVREAVAQRTDDLLRAIAAEVLARELHLAPADVAAIAQRLAREHELDEPLALHVHPSDARAAAVGTLPVIVDPALRPGDVVLRVREGALDAALGVRLAAVLEALRA